MSAVRAQARAVARALRETIQDTLPLAATRPTIDTTADSTSDITGTLWSGKTNNAPSTQWFTFVGGDWREDSPFTGFNVIADVAHAGNGTNHSANAQNNPGYRVRWQSSAPDFELYYRMGPLGSSGIGGMLLCNGERINTAYFDTPHDAGQDNAQVYTRVTWGDGSAAYAAPRTYEFIPPGSGRFGGLKTGNSYGPSPAPQSGGLRVALLGDSFIESTMGRDIGLLLGQSDTWNLGVGSTGLLNDASGTKSTQIERVNVDVIARAPDVIIDTMGFNDGLLVASLTTADYRDLVLDWVEPVLAAKPATIIFLTGPMSNGTNANSTTSKIFLGKQAAAAAYPKNIAFIDNMTDPWITGTGRVGAPASNGNADIYISSDGTHPTAESAPGGASGNLYYAEKITAGVLAELPLLIAANSPVSDVASGVLGVEAMHSVVTALEAQTSVHAANQSIEGLWLRTALALEEAAGVSSTANHSLLGYMHRAVVALEDMAGTDGGDENQTYAGLLKRLVDGFETLGADTSGTLEQRFVTGALAFSP